MNHIKIRDDCGHYTPIIERRFDSGFYDSVYSICKVCKELTPFNENIISEMEIKNE